MIVELLGISGKKNLGIAIFEVIIMRFDTDLRLYI